jgi:transposase
MFSIVQPRLGFLTGATGGGSLCPGGSRSQEHGRRWTIERLFAWLQIYRRLTNRWEYHIENFFGMVRLGCMKIMLRYL